MGISSRRRNAKGGASRFLDGLRLASYPHPYPDGWYRLADSRSLRRGQALYLECLGRALVVWRGRDSGEVFAMEAFCPHLGANLAHGTVRNDCIECPFHAWQFTGDGRPAHVPYCAATPTKAAAESFPVAEAHGQIFMYHRSSGAKQRADEEVPYPVPRVQEIDDGTLVYRGHHSAGRVSMHVIEVVENASDYAHFGHLHDRVNIPWTQLHAPGVRFEYATHLDLDDDRERFSKTLRTESVVKLFGRCIERSRTSTTVTLTGAGSIVNFRVELPDAGDIELILTQLPVAPLCQQVNLRWFADRRVPRLLSWYIAGGIMSQLRNDVAIWEAKIFRASPTLCRDDGPVMPLRRWYSQFFPDTATGTRTSKDCADEAEDRRQVHAEDDYVPCDEVKTASSSSARPESPQ